MIENILFFLIAGTFLFISGYILVKSLLKISRCLNIPEFTAAFIIMAIATSVPELFVGISSALQGVPSLSIGNILGANIINLTFVTGIFILMSKKITFRKQRIGDDVYFMLFSIILLIVLFFIGNSLSKYDGVLLLFLFLFNIYRVFKKRKEFDTETQREYSKENCISSFIIFILGLIVLFISSKYVVTYAEKIAIDFNTPEILIGLFLISFATVLPEFIFGVQAVLMRHSVMSIGDQVGTIFTNITLILGVVAIIHPIELQLELFLFPAIALLVAGILFTIMQKTDREFNRIEGLILIFFYVIFTSIMLFFNS